MKKWKLIKDSTIGPYMLVQPDGNYYRVNDVGQYIKDQETKIQGLVEAAENVMDWEFPKHLDAGYDGFLEDWQELWIALTAYKEGK